MAISGIATSIRNAACNAFVDALDVGSADASGDLQVHTAAFATLLGTLLFSATAFGAAASGVATANSITSATAVATGTASRMRCRDRDNSTCWDGTVSTSSADYNLNSVAVTSGDTIACSSFTFTVPAAA